MRYISLVCLMILSLSGYAQIESERNDYFILATKNKSLPDDTTKHLLNVSGGFDMNSNALTNDFVKALLYRGFIGDSEKDQVSKRLKNHNRFGFEFTGGFTYKYQYKPGLTILAGLYDREFAGAAFTKDAFELTFRGNSRYSGMSADLSKVNVKFMNYQSLMLGAMKSVNSNLKIGGGISLIRGGSFTSLNIKKGSLYTDTAGAYIDLNGDFNFQMSTKNKFLSSNGVGAALNFFLTYQNEKSLLSVEVRDLGMIAWRNLDTYKGNSSYRYSGIDAMDILNFSDSTFNNIKADSIAKNAGIKKERKGVTSFIPATVNVSYMYKYSEKLSIVAGVRQIFNAGYIPRVYAKGIFNLNKGFYVIPGLAFGGFGKMNFELGASKYFKNNFVISANAMMIGYLAMPKQTSGQALSLSLTKLF